MKTLMITISVFVFSFGAFSQNYRKLVDITNKWNYLDSAFTTCGGGEAKTNSLYITGDTIIEGVNYKKLMCRIIRQIDTNVVFAAGIREDTVNQIVFLKEQYAPEKVIYSFDHNAGDTISVDTTSFGDACIIRFVKSIDSYDINGFTGKKIEICDTLYDLNYPISPPAEIFTDYWYEGIGSFVSVFSMHSIGSLLIEWVDLLCFWNSDSLIYQDPAWNVCEYAIITSIDKNAVAPDLKIYPNPASDFLKISTSTKIKEINMTDIYGKTVLHSKEKNIDLSSLGNGVYVIEITTGANGKIKRKIIKNAH